MTGKTSSANLAAAYERGRKDGIAAERKRSRALLERVNARITEALALVDGEAEASAADGLHREQPRARVSEISEPFSEEPVYAHRVDGREGGK
jgi:hypothetical protein